MVVDASQLVNEVETHASRLMFEGAWVFKTKKPLDLGFVDNRSLDARRRACEEEVRLNRRLAPDVYRGVVDHRLPDGSIEPAVVMRRLPDERRLTACIADGEDVRQGLDGVARQLVALHERSHRDPHHDELASAEARLSRWRDVSDRLRPLLSGTVLEPVAARADTLAERYLARREPLFRNRMAAGRVRDGHGDLLAEDIFLLHEGPVILDCLEFDEDLRWSDVLDDVAFLAMDLRSLGRPDLAEHFLARYRELANDHWPASLLEVAVAQRAHIRAMVDAVQAHQRGEDAAEAAHDKLMLTITALEAATVRLVVLGGSPGTGKTSIAARLADEIGAVVVSSDGVRTEIPETSDPSTRYDVTARHAVYDELRRRAGALLARGESVVLDATWCEPAERAAARVVADRCRAVTTELWCVAPAYVAARRIESRRAHRGGLSEVSPGRAIRMAQDFTDWPEATVLDTTASLDHVAARAVALVRVARDDEVGAEPGPGHPGADAP
jgi:uncharacterized protein